MPTSAMHVTPRFSLLRLLCALLLCAAGAAIATPAGHPVTQRKVRLAPSADLHYSINARQSGLELKGEAQVNWSSAGKKYSVTAETRSMLIGKILEASSEGTIDNYGLAPARYVEKRFRREASTTTFNRELKTISFTQSTESYPLTGGEQDRTSIVWQLISVARGAPEKFTNGSEWSFFVAGPRDAETWSFQVIGREKIKTPLGEVNAVHVFRAPPPDDKSQTLDIWLAPSMEWYPVRLRFTDPDGDFIEQTLDKISKK